MNTPLAVATPASAPLARSVEMESVSDSTFEFRGYGIHESSCRVRVFRSKETGPAKFFDAEGHHSIDVPLRFVVIISETGHGTSVSNAIDQIASLLLPTLVPHPSVCYRVRWIEHYPHELEGRGDTFDNVAFCAYDAHGAYYARNDWGTCFSGPRWSRITKADVKALIGGGDL